MKFIKYKKVARIILYGFDVKNIHKKKIKMNSNVLVITMKCVFNFDADGIAAI
jgi:hypothetical protein